jgi:hypothetical protein
MPRPCAVRPFFETFVAELFRLAIHPKPVTEPFSMGPTHFVAELLREEHNLV